MGFFKSDLEKSEIAAARLPFNPSAAIAKTTVQEAIEQAIANAALASNDFLVRSASADLTAERVVTDTATVAWDWATTGQAKAAVVDGSITYAKMQTVAGLSVVGRSANTLGAPAAITGVDGQVLRVSGTALGFGTVVAAGIASDAVTTAKVLDNNVTLAKLAQGTALSVLGVTGNAGANYADMVAGSDGHVMRRSGSAIGFGTVVAAGLASDAVITAKILDANVTYAKFQDIAGLSVHGRAANSSGVSAAITGVDGNVLRVAGTALGFGQIAAAGITDGVITTAKLAAAAFSTSGTLTENSDTVIASQKAVKTYVDAVVTAFTGSLIFKGAFDASGGTTFPGAGVAQTGWFYRCSVAGTVDGVAFTVGDDIYAITNNASTTVYAANWLLISGAMTSAEIISTLASASITYAKIQNVAGISVFGRSANSSGVGADITAVAASDSVLRESGSAIGFGTIVAGGIASNAVTTAKILDANVTYAKINDVAGLSVVGRSANSSGVSAAITGTDGQVLRVSGTALGFGTIVAAGIAANAVVTAGILDANVTYAKIANVAGLSVMGRSANSSGVPADITGTDKQVLRVSGTSLGFGAIDATSATAITGVLQAACQPVLSGAITNAGGTATCSLTTDIIIVIGDGTNVIGTGATGRWFQMDFACTIVQATALARESGSISVDVWRTTYSSFDAGATHPVAGDKISASAPITFSTTTKSQDSTLTGWTKTLAADDVLAFNVSSVTTCKQVTITLKVTKTS